MILILKRSKDFYKSFIGTSYKIFGVERITKKVKIKEKEIQIPYGFEQLTPENKDTLIKILGSLTQETQDTLIKILGNLTQETQDTLIKILGNLTQETQDTLIKILGSLTQEAQESLLKILYMLWKNEEKEEKKEKKKEAKLEKEIEEEEKKLETEAAGKKYTQEEEEEAIEMVMHMFFDQEIPEEKTDKKTKLIKVLNNIYYNENKEILIKTLEDLPANYIGYAVEKLYFSTISEKIHLIFLLKNNQSITKEILKCISSGCLDSDCGSSKNSLRYRNYYFLLFNLDIDYRKKLVTLINTIKNSFNSIELAQNRLIGITLDVLFYQEKEIQKQLIDILYSQVNTEQYLAIIKIINLEDETNNAINNINLALTSPNKSLAIQNLLQSSLEKRKEEIKPGDPDYFSFLEIEQYLCLNSETPVFKNYIQTKSARTGLWLKYRLIYIVTLATPSDIILREKIFNSLNPLTPQSDPLIVERFINLIYTLAIDASRGLPKSSESLDTDAPKADAPIEEELIIPHLDDEILFEQIPVLSEIFFNSSSRRNNALIVILNELALYSRGSLIQILTLNNNSNFQTGIINLLIEFPGTYQEEIIKKFEPLNAPYLQYIPETFNRNLSIYAEKAMLSSIKKEGGDYFTELMLILNELINSVTKTEEIIKEFPNLEKDKFSLFKVVSNFTTNNNKDQLINILKPIKDEKKQILIIDNLTNKIIQKEQKESICNLTKWLNQLEEKKETMNLNNQQQQQKCSNISCLSFLKKEHN